MQIAIQEKFKYFHVVYQDGYYFFGEYDFTDFQEFINLFVSPFINNESFVVAGKTVKSDEKKRFYFLGSNEESEDIKRDNDKAITVKNKSQDITRECIRIVNESRTLHSQPVKKNQNRKVFIVHGHDKNVILEVESLLKDLKLEPIILHKQPNKGVTIIEKLEKHTDVAYAIILYTPCDMGKEKSETDLHPRARQNVIFEHGYLMGKLGRDRVCALYKNEIELPGDYSGVLFVPYAENSSDWKLSLVKELKASGFDVTADDIS